MFRASYWGSGARVPPYLFSTLFTSLLISASEGICWCMVRNFFICAPFCMVWFLSSFSFVFSFLLIWLIWDLESSKTEVGLCGSTLPSRDFLSPPDLSTLLLRIEVSRLFVWLS